MEDIPRGTVTFLFTDIEGSTRLWEERPEAMPEANARHDAILREAIVARKGLVYKVVGDAFQIAFPTATDAVGAAQDAQVALQAEAWPLPEPLRVRMAIHTGEVNPDAQGDYRSPVLNRLGRLMDVGYGAQVLATQSAVEQANEDLPDGARFIDLGSRRLKDLGLPEHVYQLSAPGLVDVFPALRTLDARPHNLPTQLSRFIGRRDDMDALRDLFGWPDVRLVTLTGPGGIGKTRLALQAGADMLEWFDDGVFLVRLEALTDPADAVPAVAQALGLGERAATDPDAAVRDHLRDKQLLLILDNVEQVIECAVQIGDLLTACSRVKVLATSRTRLRLRGEREYALSPLALPDVAGERSLEILSQFDSLHLFVDRAQMVAQSFRLTHENAATVAEVCLRLDGIPLAIELAAARIRMFPPEAMLKRVASRLPLLTGGARDLPARQQTLRQTIAWSYALLDAPAQALFRRLSVFAGGATLEAIDAVAVDEDDDWDLLTVLESLVDQSLMRQIQLEGDPRFTMFEAIREFGIERLAAEGEIDEAQQRHAAYFAGYPALGYTAATAEDAIRQVDLVETERDNLRLARDWTLRHDLDLAYELLDTKAIIWNWRVPTREEVRWTRDVVAAEPSGVDEEVRARCRMMYAYFCYWYPDDLGGIASALNMAREAYHAFTTMGKPEWVLRTLVVSSNLELSRHRQEEAIAYIEEAVVVARIVGNPMGLFSALNNVGNLAHNAGDFARARELLEEALLIARGQPQRPDAIADGLNNLGQLGLAENNLSAARQSFRDGLAFCIDQRQPVQLMMSMVGLAIVAARSDRWHQVAWLGGAIEELKTSQEFGITTELKPMVDQHEAHMAGARDRVSDDNLTRLLREGAAASLEDGLERVTEPADADGASVETSKLR